MCSEATLRNKASYWVQIAWVNVRLGASHRKQGKLGEGAQSKRGEEIKRKRGAMRWGAQLESFVIACALCCAIPSSI